MAMLTSDAPPWVTNGSGMPVIGMIPSTIPALTMSWNRIIEASPAANIVPKGSFDRQPATRIRHRSSTNRTNSDHHADEPELLGEDREHEVGGLDRQELALGLRAVRQALAHPAARPDRDLCLVELVAGALDVRAGVEERQ